MKLSNEHASHERKQERAEKWGDAPRVRMVKPGGFFDGNLKESFEEIGQNPYIKTNEVREIPKRLLERCIASGAQFEIVL